MSHPARLSLRAPPHLPFIQGYPGIPAGPGRSAAGVSGTVEVRVGAQAVKAKWVRVEIRRHEQLPPGFPAQEPIWEHVGEINTLWSSPQGKEYDGLDTADFKFFLPLPETTPPSVEMMKGSGVAYELVAALCYKRKGGIFKSDSPEIIKISEPLTITKHELHSAWPVYNNPDSKAATAGEVTMTINRPGVAFGPGDRILLTASMRSSRAIPFKLRGFECTLMEVVTMFATPTKGKAKDKKSKKAAAGPVVKSRPIAQARCAVDESVGRGGEKSARIEMAVPAENLLVTVRHAKTMEVGYELQIKAVCDGFEGPVVSAIRYVVGVYSKEAAQRAIQEIGNVPSLCPFTSPPASQSASNSGTTPRPQSSAAPPTQHQHTQNGLAPFTSGDWRRQSSSTITTMTDRNHQAPTSGPGTAPAPNDWLPLPGGRPFSTLPARHVSPNPSLQGSAYQAGSINSHNPSPMGSGTGHVPFPTASPAPTDRMYRSASPTVSDYSSMPDDRPVSMAPLSDAGHGVMAANRQSSATMGTMATFGAWDKGLQRNLQGVEESVAGASSPSTISTSTVQNPWQAAESEKIRLYDTARKTAAALHLSTGVPLGIVGLDEIPDTAPPEYAPPVPPIPAVVAEERSRPGSTYLATPPLTQGGMLPGIAPISPLIGSPSGVMMGGTSGVGSPLVPGSPVSATNALPAAGSSSTTPAPAAKNRANGNIPTALSEKEQMRRYFEAKDRAERAARGEGSPEESDEDIPEANTAGGAGSANAGPAPRSGSGSGQPREAASDDQRKAAVNNSANPAPTTSPYMSAAQEKEAMRQRYEEATWRANRARSSLGQAEASGTSSENASPNKPSFAGSLKNGGAPLQNTASRFDHQTAAPKPSDGASISSAAGPSGGYMSAEQEKDAMRKRFEEAQSRVDRACGRPRASDQGPASVAESSQSNAGQQGRSTPLLSSNGPDAPSCSGALITEASSTPTPAAMSASKSTDSAYPSAPMTASGTGAGGWQSAEEEKEAMRRRFEQASSRVVSGGSGSGFGGAAAGANGGSAKSSRPLPPARPLDTTGSGSGRPKSMQPSARAPDGQSSNGYTPPVSAGPTSSFGPDSTADMGQSNGTKQTGVRDGNAEPMSGAGAGSSNGGAPPPLPARPPADYINLLSPTEAPNKRFSFA